MNDFDPTDVRGCEDREESESLKAKIALDNEADALKWVMGNKKGRTFIFRLLERAGVWRSTFSSDALMMAFGEGKRNEGLKLMADLLTHCEKRYGDMVRENGNNE